MKILSLQASGFKNIEDSDNKTYTFSNHTIIKGENYTGKTSICEGICWALFGCNMNGNDKADSLLLNNKSKKIYVKLEFEGNDGKVHILEREKGKTCTIALDGNKASQGDIFSYTGDKQTFLAAFVPGYFDAMAPVVARTFLTGILPAIPREQVLAEMAECFRSMAPNTLNINEYLSDKRSQLKALETEGVRLNGSFDAYYKNLSIEVPEEVIFDDADLKKYQSELSGLRSNATVKPSDSTLKFLISKKEQLKARYVELVKRHKVIMLQVDKVCPTCGQTLDVAAGEKAKQESISKIMAEMATVIEEGNTMNGEIKNEQTAYDDLIADYKEPNTEYADELEQSISEQQHFSTEARVKNSTRSTMLKQVETAQVEVTNIETRLKEIDDEKAHINSLMSAGMEYATKKSELQYNQIKDRLDKVTIRLEKVIKSTGEIKECFEMLYDGKELVLCSTSERVRKELEIANLINSMTGLKVPVFIDSAESITHYNKPNTQVIEAVVCEGITEIEITNFESEVD